MKLLGDVSRQTGTSSIALDDQHLPGKPPRSPVAEATFKRYITQINKVTSLLAGDL
jgi:hypothetical protein